MSVKIMKNSVSLKDETTQTFLPIGMFAAGGDKSLKEFKEFADTTVNEANRQVQRAHDQVQRAHDNVDQLTESITSALETGTDTTLSLPGVAADAKVTGNKIGELKSDLSNLSSEINNLILYDYQYIKKEKIENGKYWNRVVKGATVNADTVGIVEPFTVEQGEYIFHNIMGYYSYWVGDDNVIHTFSDITNSCIRGKVNITSKATVYITVSGSNPLWNNGMFIKGSTPNSYIEGNCNIRFFDNDANRIFVVDKSRLGQFYTLKDGISEAIKHKNSTVIVFPGVYDLISEWGENYLDNFDNTTDDTRGIILTNGIHVKFLEGAKVKFLYDGNNEKVKNYFSPFFQGYMNGGDFVLENLDLESSNCRYGIHDDPENYGGSYTHKYINCKIKHSGENYRPAIGAGLGKNCTFIIDGGYFESNSFSGNGTVSIHNSVSAEAQSKVIIKDVYFEKKSDSEGGNVRLGYYGQSNKITTAYISNCSFETDILLVAENSNSSTENIQIKEWNNEIRS